MIIDIIFNIIFSITAWLLRLWEPLRIMPPYRGYVRTLQWWLITAVQQCAAEGI
jgi:hypothetical protein